MRQILSATQIEQYREEGYALLERVIDPVMLTILREECAYFLGYKDAQLDARGVDSEGITHKGKRYFISNMYRTRPAMRTFLFSELMAAITRALLGPEVYLFNEQWVVKGAEQGMQFAWHQDSGYVKYFDSGTRHAPYMTCWCALDDVDETNGAVFVMPHSRVGSHAQVFDHAREPGTNDLVGYTGGEPGVLLAMPAGSIGVFTSTSLHRSGSNTTSSMRRAYLAQYSCEPLTGSGGDLWAQAVPFMADGEIVYDAAGDTYERWTSARIRKNRWTTT